MATLTTQNHRIIVFFVVLLTSHFGSTERETCQDPDALVHLSEIILNRDTMSCTGRCGKAVKVDNTIITDELTPKAFAFRTTSCSCDVLCRLFNDCCHGFEETCSEESEKFYTEAADVPQGMSRHNLGDTCRNGCDLKRKHDCEGSSVRMISKCMSSGRQCETIDDKDPNRFIPVYDRKTNLHYVHLECAKCNRATSMEPWLFSIECHNQDVDREQFSGKNLREILAEKSCSIEVEPRPDMDGIRECFSDMKTSCPDSCTNQELIDKCVMEPSCYASAVVNDTGFPVVSNFKNFYCGVCNGVPPEAIKCGYLYARGTVVYTHSPYRPVSLTTLFEFKIEVGFYVSQLTCATGTVSTPLGCIDITRIRNATFECSFFSNIPRDTHNDLALTDEGKYEKVLEEANKIFRTHSVRTSGNEINFKIPEDDSSDLLMRVTFEIESPGSSDDFLSSLTKVEEVLRSVSKDVAMTKKLGSFRVAVKVGVDQDSLHVQAKNMPVVCHLSESTSRASAERTQSEIEMHCLKEESEDPSLSPMDVVTYVCICCSIVCLFLRVCLQCFIPHFRSGPGRMQFNMSLALLLAFVAWLVGSYLPEHEQSCKAFAVIRYFAFLAAFAWMTNIAVDTWRLFRPHAQLLSPDETTTPFYAYHLFGWAGPFLLSGLVMIIDFVDVPPSFKPNFGPPFCWIVGKMLVYYFFIPTGLLFVTNIILFICTAFTLRTSFKESNAVVKKRQRNFQVYVKLFLLMGITWSLGFVVGFTDFVALEYIYTVINSLQGVLIFVAFVCTKRTFAHFVRKYHLYSMSSSSKGRTGSTPLASSKSQ